MTLRLYADHKKLALGRISVDVSHAKIHARDCEECSQLEREGDGRIDRFERIISIDGDVSQELGKKLGEIAAKCPVHRTLETNAKITTLVKPANN
jgi:putative redox protein